MFGINEAVSKDGEITLNGLFLMTQNGFAELNKKVDRFEYGTWKYGFGLFFIQKRLVGCSRQA